MAHLLWLGWIFQSPFVIKGGRFHGPCVGSRNTRVHVLGSGGDIPGPMCWCGCVEYSNA